MKIFLLCRNYHPRFGHKCNQSRDISRSTYTSVAEEWKNKHKLCQPFGFCPEDSILVVLSRVCSSWHTFVLSTPVFWDTVWLHHPLFLLQQRAPLRRDVPIIVKGHSNGSFCCGAMFDTPDPVIAMNWLLTTCPRIKAIDLSLPFISINNTLLRLCSRPFNLEGMWRLSLDDKDSYNIFNHARESRTDWGQPQSYRSLTSLPLLSLSLNGIRPPSWLPSTSLSHLQSLTLHFPISNVDSLHDLIRVLVACSPSLQDASLSFAASNVLSYHQDVSTQTAKFLTDCLASFPPIRFAKLMKLKISNWGGSLIHALLNLLDAPHSTCEVRFGAVPDFWDYLDAKPMTAEWGCAIGNYNLSHTPIPTFAPSRSSNILNTSSIRFPDIILARDPESIFLGNGAFDIVQLAVTLQNFVNITELVLNIATFIQTYSKKNYPTLDIANRGEEPLRREYSLAYDLGFPKMSNEPRDGTECDRLIELLAQIPGLQAFHLMGLTGVKYDDEYLGIVLSIPSPGEIARNVICPRLVSLVLEYDLRSPKVDEEMYLVWVYQVLVSRLHASVAGSAQAITQAEILLHASNLRHTKEDAFTPEERKLYDKVNAQVQRMKATLGSSVAFSARLYSEPIYVPDMHI